MVNRPPADLSNDSSQYENIKCVVVGDAGVGKTCLVRAWACDIKYTLEQLVKTHVSTVWATDHYRHDREVLDRSFCHVDDVKVSLRLWDTFGYHDKDRSFAYKGADVVLLCFSVVKPSSLRNLVTRWHPEIRSMCSTTPIVVVGTQADMRYMYKDKVYREMNKGLLYKCVEKADIIYPEKAREVARDMGAPYYESSVVTHYGVEEVFFNVVRAAMVERRKIKFWNTQLRRIQYPLIQPPMACPRPTLPSVSVAASTLSDDLCYLVRNQCDGDVLFDVRGVCYPAYKICLAVSSETFREILLMNLEERNVIRNSSREEERRHSGGNGNGKSERRNGKEDKQILIENVDVSDDAGSITDDSLLEDHFDLYCKDRFQVHYLNHAAFEKIEVKTCQNHHDKSIMDQKTIVTVNPEISPRAFQYVLQYLYTGKVTNEYQILEDVKRAAELLKMFPLLLLISNLQTQESYLNLEMEKRFHADRCEKLRDIALKQGLLSDIRFEVDDGILSAHKSLLMSRCEMMAAMFSDHFIEASADLIPLPGITKEVFCVILEYLYTDTVVRMDNVDHLSVIALANRLCLPRLVHLMERFVVAELTKAAADDEDILEEVLLLIESSQFHNAAQLAHWCVQYACVHYREVTNRFGKLLRSLQKENQTLIEENQWPPAWYIKEKERYDLQCGQKMPHLQIQQKAQFSRWQQCRGSCFCFCRRSKVVMDEDTFDFPM